MNAAEYEDSFLLTQFREFYAEALRLKRLIETGAWVYLPNVERDGEEPPERENAAQGSQELQRELSPYAKVSTAVWTRLLSLFERQTLLAHSHGGSFGVELYKEALYVMVALSDEIFLNLEWEGKRSWISNLLESKIFGSHAAGELLFQKLERLLQDRDRVNRDLAAVYLLALSLGFRGKFRDFDDRGQIARYREKLYSFIFQHKPDLLTSKHLFPEAYARTVREQKRKRVMNPKVWIAILIGVILLYGAASRILWVDLTSRLNETNSRISETVKELNRTR